MPDSFSSVPRVNYSRLHNPTTRQKELDRLREAIFVVGFLYLTDTGLEVRANIDGYVDGTQLTVTGAHSAHP